MNNIDKALNELFSVFGDVYTVTVKEFGLTKKMIDTIVLALVEELEAGQSDWAKKVKKKLSDKLPNKMRGKRRLPRTRLFPYRNSGDLADNIETRVRSEHRIGGGYTIKVDFEFLSEHSFITNYGFTSIKGKRSDGAWVGWATDLLDKQGRAGIISARDVTDKVFTKNRIEFFIEQYLAGLKK